MIAAIVLAGGMGTRFGSPKQFVELVPGKRLIDAALAVARAVSDQVVLVLPADAAWDGPPVDAIGVAGNNRLGSVANALVAVDSRADVVLIHDAAHPLATTELARRVIGAVRDGADGAVPVLPFSDVVKRITAGGSLETVGRDDMGIAQAPQAFSRSALSTAHARPAADAWEDSELIERAGGRVVGVQGEPTNMHVVTEIDIALARLLLPYCTQP